MPGRRARERLSLSQYDPAALRARARVQAENARIDSLAAFAVGEYNDPSIPQPTTDSPDRAAWLPHPPTIPSK